MTTSHPYVNGSESRKSPFTTIIFDIGDVLFSWKPPQDCSIAPKKFKRLLRSVEYFQYECGRLTEDEFFEAAAATLALPDELFEATAASGVVSKDEIARAFQVARTSLTAHPLMAEYLFKWKTSHRLLGMSNISAKDFEFLRQKAFPWTCFERIYTSAEAGFRKPDLRFFEKVIEDAGIDPRRTLFIDDKVENVLAARSFGLVGLVYHNEESAVRILECLCQDPLARAKRWLLKNARNLHAISSTGRVIQENYCQLLILELTGRPELVQYEQPKRLFHFYQGDGMPNAQNFPYDSDTTSLGMLVCPNFTDALRHSVLDEILTYISEDGIVQMYMDRTRPRTDPAVCMNHLAFAETLGRGDEPRLARTRKWVLQILQYRAYLSGTQYYPSPEVFLWFFWRFLQYAPADRAEYIPLLRDRVKERIGCDPETCSLALRMLLCSELGLDPGQDLARLVLMQGTDGGWPGGMLYRYPNVDMRVGHRGLMTCVVIKAIENFRARGVEVDFSSIVA